MLEAVDRAALLMGRLAPKVAALEAGPRGAVRKLVPGDIAAALGGIDSECADLGQWLYMDDQQARGRVHTLVMDKGADLAWREGWQYHSRNPTLFQRLSTMAEAAMGELEGGSKCGGCGGRGVQGLKGKGIVPCDACHGTGVRPKSMTKRREACQIPKGPWMRNWQPRYLALLDYLHGLHGAFVEQFLRQFRE